MDYDIGCTLHCKVHLWLNMSFLLYFSDLGGLKYKFQIFISVLLNFLNAFELYIPKFD
jgi:hypothetical protein